MFYVYVLQSSVDNSIYLGYSSNLRQRLTKHNNGENISTKANKPWKLIYYEAYQARNLAMAREKQLKRYAKSLAMLKKRIGL